MGVGTRSDDQKAIMMAQSTGGSNARSMPLMVLFWGCISSLQGMLCKVFFPYALCAVQALSDGESLRATKFLNAASLQHRFLGMIVANVCLHVHASQPCRCVPLEQSKALDRKRMEEK
jgi:hypothetical protein